MLLYSPEKKHQMFIEYIESLLIQDDDEFKIWKFGDDIIIDDKHKIVIFLQVIPNQGNKLIFKNTKPVNVFICNTEQLSHYVDALLFNITTFYEYTKTVSNVSFGIIDYSQQNVNIIKEKIKNIKSYYIPYQYNKKEIDFLTSCSSHEKRIVTCGCNTGRRSRILNGLHDEGIKINNAKGFGPERDKNIMSHMILLNISAHDDFSIYEHIRCDRLIFAKMVIVSDHKTDEHLLDMHKFIVWSNDNDFSTTICEVLNNYDYYKNKITDEELEKVIHTRRKMYMDFRKEFEF